MHSSMIPYRNIYCYSIIQYHVINASHNKYNNYTYSIVILLYNILYVLIAQYIYYKSSTQLIPNNRVIDIQPGIDTELSFA